MKKRSNKGFTVLELLIVIGIMSMLVALVLMSLNQARQRSNDERKVAALRPVVVGLREYFNICRQYPATLAPTEACADLTSQQKSLKDIIPESMTLNFNTTGSPYHYASLISTADASNPECSNFHLWVELGSANQSLASQKSNVGEPYTSNGQVTGQSLSLCSMSAAGLPIASQNNTIFDIFK